MLSKVTKTKKQNEKINEKSDFYKNKEKKRTFGKSMKSFNENSAQINHVLKILALIKPALKRIIWTKKYKRGEYL